MRTFKIAIVSNPQCNSYGPTKRFEAALKKVADEDVVIVMGDLLNDKFNSCVFVLNKLINNIHDDSRYVYLCPGTNDKYIGRYMKTRHGNRNYSVQIKYKTKIILLIIFLDINDGAALKFLKKRLHKYKDIRSIVITCGQIDRDLVEIYKKNNIWGIFSNHLHAKNFVFNPEGETTKIGAEYLPNEILVSLVD